MHVAPDRPMFRRHLLFLACAFAWPLIDTVSAAAGEAACFPACRSGFVCDPAGRCVSACNPPCDAGERCEAGECRAKVAEVAVSTAAEVARPPHFAIVGGPLFQVIGNAAGLSTIASAATGGFDVAFHYEAGDKSRFFVGPRFQLLFYPSPTPEVGVDLGYRGRFGSGKFRIGPVVWLEPLLWIQHVSLPYLGARAGVAGESGALFFDATVGGGVALDTTEPSVQVGPSFSAGGELGVLF
jgi:hypothetical protein